MRRLLESLTPASRHVYWRRVGSVFALYVVLIITAAGVFVSHESPRKFAQEGAATVATGGEKRAIQIPVSIRQAARD
jgi:hypothetical protein